MVGNLREAGPLARPILFGAALVLSLLFATLTSRAIEYLARAFRRRVQLPFAKASMASK
jgi:peptidoglycan/LPS O-acetylase OafA/YrhL